MSDDTRAVASAVREAALDLTGTARDYDPLLDLIGDARVVGIGEASHGTHEFYHVRAEITKRLIAERGFTAVAAEADWPDAYRVNCYVRGESDDPDADAALAGFKRFPQWMWRNTVVLEFVEWLRRHNASLPASATRAGFYGLDLYSLHRSIEAVIDYLAEVDPEAARRARYRYSCFDHFGEDPQRYGYAASFNLTATCQQEVISQLVELQRRAPEYAARDGRAAQDRYFYAEQNARLVRDAEEYYRTMFRGRVSSWNLRDCHMADTLDALIAHLERVDGSAKVVIWAHNSHLGDARATEMGEGGELNVGQLVRERYGERARLIGFSTYTGTVTAASDWGGAAERKWVRPALPGSYEALFHAVGAPTFMLNLRGAGTGLRARVAGGSTSSLERPRPAALAGPRLQRAIGVIYRPETERPSHYFHARLTEQFDAMLHLDETRALEPLERTGEWERGELPETYPFNV